jgi:hypothetical protein
VNSIGILSCDTVTVLGSKRHCEYACSAAPSSCWFPVLLSIRAPVTLPVCLSIVTKTTPFPVSPCLAHSFRYSGFGVKTAFGAIAGRAGLAGWACSEERATSVRIKTSSQPIIFLTKEQSQRARAGRASKNPWQSGPRTHGSGDFPTCGAAFAISITAAGEESSAIRAIAECAVGGALRFIYQATSLSLNLHINAAASGVDINSFLRGGKADYHTGLI